MPTPVSHWDHSLTSKYNTDNQPPGKSTSTVNYSRAVLYKMPSPESDTLRQLFIEFASAFDAAKGRPDLNRAIYDGVHKVASEPTGVTYEDTLCNNVPCKWIRPADASPKHIMLFMHGGAFTFGSTNGHRKLSAHLAKAARCTGLSVEYRLAPEFPYPAGLDDCVAVYRWLLQNGFLASNICVAGDSCGGSLATVVPLALIKQGVEIPAASVALSPSYDHTLEGQTMVTNAENDVLQTKAGIAELTQVYTQGRHDIRDPFISPTFAKNLGDLPPTWISCAGYDMLCDQGEGLAEKAKAAGAEVVLEVHPGMQHVFEFMAGRAPEADESIRKIGEWIQQKLHINQRI